MSAFPWMIAAVAALVVQSCYAEHPMENEGMFEGDIAGIDPYPDRNAVVDEAELWPGGIVYYDIDRKLKDVRDILMEAIKEYETKTCLRFRKRTAATKDYIYITIVSGCWSSVGRKGGEQMISLSYGCHDKVSAIHELGHAIGLWHEHSRSDRDKYLEIIWDNIKKGSEHNFVKLLPWENNLLNEEFDYKSIMLYGEYAFAKDRNSMTMKPRKEGVVIGLINDKPGLSDSDVRRINKLYQCFGNVRPPRPEVPDFKCDFENGTLCGFENQNNVFNNWEIAEGTLGGRTGKYLMISSKESSFRKIRIVSPFFGAFGRKKSCFSFDIYFHGAGVVSLDVKVHSVHTSKLLIKHVHKKDEWQRIQVGADLEGDVKFSLDAHTTKFDAEGIIALDNILYQWHPCS